MILILFSLSQCAQTYAAEGRFTFTSHNSGEHGLCLHSNSSTWFGGGQLVCSTIIFYILLHYLHILLFFFKLPSFFSQFIFFSQIEFYSCIALLYFNLMKFVPSIYIVYQKISLNNILTYSI